MQRTLKQVAPRPAADSARRPPRPAPRNVLTDSLLRPAAAQHMLDQGIDAWFTFHNPPHGDNQAALRLLRAESINNLTALVMAVVYPNRKPVLICSRLEEDHYRYFRKLGKVVPISSSEERNAAIREATAGCHRIALEHTPGMLISGASIISAAMLQWFRRMSKAKIVSSGDLLQAQICVLTPAELQSHERAAHAITAAVHRAFAYISDQVGKGTGITEYDVQQFLLDQFRQAGLRGKDPPIVAVGSNAADPHYSPEKEGKNAARLKTIRPGDLVLFDMWDRGPGAGDIYADLGWMAYVGSSLPRNYDRAFRVLVDARDAALEKMQELFAREMPLDPGAVDKAARDVVIRAGYPDYRMHGTGHSITTLVHGEGVAIGPTTSAKGHDTRLLLPGTLSSDEPGIYKLNRWGMRIEADVYIDPKAGPRATCEIQKEMVLIH